ncbi:hypothetical protein N5C43_11040 [Comamonas terrigena]|uniref:hypothetical protein n=1 Tax=Comamonas terrigena TaxID=32013 RepID=UPI002447711A|nr:hypothetical protein [Comamonas terrigena]MDH1291792.1 hypothetical protein [Comamonas terrigena]
MKIQVKDGKVELKIEGAFNSEQLQELIFQIGEARREIASDPESLANADVDLQVTTSPCGFNRSTQHTR